MEKVETKKKNYYGMIGISKIQSTNAQLFGSSIRHGHYIDLSISRGSVQRRHNQDHTFKEEELIEVSLSTAQFSDLLMSMNTQGVPCTIRHINGKKMDDCQELTERAKLQNDFESQIKDINKSVSDLVDTITGLSGKMSKKAQEEMHRAAQKIITEIEHNLPFVRETYNESIDKTIGEAKAEIDAFIKERDPSNKIEAKPNQILNIENE